MKKLTLYVMTGCMLFSVLPMPLKAVNGNLPVSAPAKMPVQETSEMKIMESRIAEIKAMDRSKLSGAEKKQLRKELRTMKGALNAANGGVYLSVGAIIVIILLLILLL